MKFNKYHFDIQIFNSDLNQFMNTEIPSNGEIEGLWIQSIFETQQLLLNFGPKMIELIESFPKPSMIYNKSSSIKKTKREKFILNQEFKIDIYQNHTLQLETKNLTNLSPMKRLNMVFNFNLLGQGKSRISRFGSQCIDSKSDYFFKFNQFYAFMFVNNDDLEELFIGRVLQMKCKKDTTKKSNRYRLIMEALISDSQFILCQYYTIQYQQSTSLFSIVFLQEKKEYISTTCWRYSFDTNLLNSNNLNIAFPIFQNWVKNENFSLKLKKYKSLLK